MSLTLGFTIGYGAAMAPVLINVLEKLSSRHGFNYTVITPYRYSREDLEALKKANVVLVYSSPMSQEIEDILKGLRDKGAKIIAVDENHAELSNVNPRVVSQAAAYLKIGGRENIESLVLLMLKEAGLPVSVPEPENIPWHGIYHPRYGVFTELNEYLKTYHFSSRPLVGILFYRSDWLYGRTVVVDKLVEKLESLGLGVVPVFTYSFRDDKLGIPGSEDSIREFFFKDNKPVIDVLIKLTSFFLLDHGRSSEWPTKGFSVAGIELLKKLGVPIIQCIITYYKSPEEWLRDEHGVGYMTIVYRVAMPEVDGVIEPIVVAGTKVGGYGEKKIISIDEHIDYIARRVKKWIVLRRKKPCERRIAIVLINPPCKGVEANIGVGLGLDVPESVVRFLKKLKEEGYNVGDKIPETGEELIKMFMEKKAFSEFRWTPVEEIVARGGALGFVGREEYLKWFNELPETVRKKMIETWGSPDDVLMGRTDKVLAGMVYEGKFVVPGLRFGNIIVLPQPKRGCAGPRCDGRVCKILHDPTIPPPHQWLAVYRWITRVFKADVVIHFGTHGYLEFLPGKGVGLSWMCWPEISIDDVPHLYVYVVSNPMEGVVAKRRGYAVIVDHLYPPMKHADVLSDLESLLAQYSHAKTMGDNARASITYKQLLEKAREHNIKLPSGASEEEVVEYLHRYIHMVKNTQVNKGLHILGHPPVDARELAEYVATIMSFDTYRTPSIKRVLAEYLGLDYDELRRKPMELNKVYGIRNSELLDRLHLIAVSVLEKLIEREDMGEEEIIRVVEEEARRWLQK
ncbi:cobaltochelatase subunit CobN [Desulfurococcaceae archaeon MEX13E-LK6-19]|nr:cobaltochelatase subunit CobN [Desulfurococcaceae archaeon MEX13E-LK6-19]